MADKNVLMISVDDLLNFVRYRDAFGPAFQTPNIDRLMDEGFTFHNTNSVVPLCKPSRAATMTSKTAFETGVYHNQDHEILNTVAPGETLTGHFDDAGYYVAGMGKVYHGRLGANHDPALSPILDVFDEIQPTEGWLGLANTPTDTGPAPVPDANIEDGVTTDWAVDFLTDYAGADPYFLAVGIYKPHLSWTPPQEYFDLYTRSEIDLEALGLTDRTELPDFMKQYITSVRNNYTDDEWRAFIHGYMASVSYADAKVGEILDALDASGKRDETTVVLWSDHGFHLGDHDTWKKFTLFESATSVPFIISDPDIGAPGGSTQAPVSLLDLFPTLASVAGVAGAGGASGLDVSALMTGGTVDRDGVISHAWGSISYRDETYRLTMYHDGEIQLYNSVTDPLNDVDLAGNAGQATRIAQMKAAMAAELATLGVTLTEEGGVAIGSGASETFVVIGDGEARGGGGDDLYHITEDATIVETAGGGEDTVYYTSRTPYALPDHIENIVAAARTRLDVDGTSADNLMEGGGQADNIRAHGGDDWLDGGGNNDALFGGAGDDTYNFTFTWGNDLISEEADGGTDTIRFQEDVYVWELAFSKVGDDLLIYSMDDEGLEVEEQIRVESQFNGGRRIETIIFENTGQTLDVSEIARKTTMENDVVMGSLRGEVFYGLAGDDVIRSLPGRDTVFGGEGDDKIYTGGGMDTLFGGTGDDTLTGGGGADVYVVNPTPGDTVTIRGFSTGLDVIDLSMMRYGDAVDGVAGARVEGGDVVMRFAGGGELRLAERGLGQFDATADVLLPEVRIGSLGSAIGGAEDDTLVGADLPLTMAGLNGNDAIDGSAREDRLIGGFGQDLIRGFDGADVIYGGRGADILQGRTGGDFIYAGDGDLAWLADDEAVRVETPYEGVNTGDYLRGGKGSDQIVGDAGADTLYGDKGFDTLAGALGDDLLYSGTGQDIFVFRPGDGNDLIKDFSDGFDRIKFFDLTRDDLSFADDGADHVVSFAGGSARLEGAAGITLTWQDLIFV